MKKIKVNSIPKWKKFNGAKNYNFRSFVQDNTGNIWASTWFDGIFLVNEKGELIQHYHPNNPAANSLFHGQANHTYLDNDQNLWVGSVPGIAMKPVDSEGFIEVFDENENSSIPYVLHFHQLPSGEILASTIQHGIYLADQIDGEWKLKQIYVSNDIDDFYEFIYGDDLGTIYASYKLKELQVFKYTEGKLHKLTTLPISGYINGVYEDIDGKTLWLASSTGLVELDKTNIEAGFRLYTQNDGLISNQIMGILADDNNDLWISTKNGIVKFNRLDTTFQSLSMADGANSATFYEHAALKHADGSLWFGGNNGITIIRPDDIKLLENEPIVHITDIMINDEPFAGLADELTGATNVTNINNMHRSYSENTISFDFVAIDYSDPQATQLEYFMEGEDHNWVTLEKGAPGFARYSNLSPGDYIFKVRAYNSDGIPGKEKSMMKITIDPPWYLRWWAIASYIVIVASIIYGYYRFRIAQIRKEEAFKRKEIEYKQLVAETETAVLRLQMNPHFIFNSMNSINSYILQKDVDTASDYLESICKRLMRMILKFAAKPLIAISDEIELLELYLQTEAMRFEKKFDYSFELKDDLDPDEFVIPTMILQPFVENAIWHGISNKKDGEGKIKMSFWQEGEAFFAA